MFEPELQCNNYLQVNLTQFNKNKSKKKLTYIIISANLVQCKVIYLKFKLNF